MRIGPIQKLVFILYCVEVGVLLLLTPWSASWDRSVVQIPVDALRDFALQPAVRAAISGFGVVHLVWAAHDFDLWLVRRKPRKSGSA